MQVTDLKLWKDVCRVVKPDLTGLTSASYNMRHNYEKCLLEFEDYMASERYTVDMEAGRPGGAGAGARGALGVRGWARGVHVGHGGR